VSRPYKTKNIDIAATIQAVTRITPEISYEHDGLALFTFPSTEGVISAFMGYESSLEVDARTLLTTRNQLFKRIRGGAR
jgi:hypothetical protein